MMRHRDAWAEENLSPSLQEWQREEQAEARSSPDKVTPEKHDTAPKVRRVVPSGSSTSSAPNIQTPPRTAAASAAVEPSSVHATQDDEGDDVENDVLVVVSKLKKYVRVRSGMNTSDTAIPLLSNHLRALCTEAIRNAAREGRKTVLDRDFTPLVVKRPQS